MARNRNDLLVAVAWAIWAGLLLLPFLSVNSVTFLTLANSIVSILSALWFWGMALGLGRRVMRGLGAFEGMTDDLRSELSLWMICAGTGLGVISVVFLGVGLWIGVSPFIFLMTLALLALGVGSGWLEMMRTWKRMGRRLVVQEWGCGEIFVLLPVGGIALLQLPAALTPTLYPDTLRYHFGLTRLFAEMGQVAPLRDFAEANLSSNWQMIYMPQLLLSDEGCAQVFNWMTLLFTVAAVALAAGPGAWGAAALTLISTPFLLGVAGLGNNDLGVAFFAALMVLALRCRGLCMPWAWAGTFGGLAMGTKYPALLPVTALGLACLGTGMATVGKSRLRWVIGFGLGVFAGYAPWFFRNLSWTGDPFYPVLSRWLPWCGPEGPWVSAHYAREMAHYGQTAGGWMDLLMAPWKASVADGRYFESDPGVIFWCAAPLVAGMAWRAKPGSWMRTIAWAAAMGVGFWLMGPHVTRFLAPLAPILALAVGEAWRLFREKREGHGLLCGAGLLFVGINVWQTMASVSGFSDTRSFLLQGMTRDQYFTKHHPLYRVSEWLNDKMGKGERTLLFGEEDVYLFNHPVQTSGPFNHKWIVEQASASRSSAELASRLRREGVRWICFDPARVDALDARFGYASWPSTESRARFAQMLREEARLVREDGGVRVFVLGGTR